MQRQLVLYRGKHKYFLFHTEHVPTICTVESTMISRSQNSLSRRKPWQSDDPFVLICVLYYDFELTYTLASRPFRASIISLGVPGRGHKRRLVSSVSTRRRLPRLHVVFQLVSWTPHSASHHHTAVQPLGQDKVNRSMQASQASGSTPINHCDRDPLNFRPRSGSQSSWLTSERALQSDIKHAVHGSLV